MQSVQGCGGYYQIFFKAVVRGGDCDGSACFYQEQKAYTTARFVNRHEPTGAGASYRYHTGWDIFRITAHRLKVRSGHSTLPANHGLVSGFQEIYLSALFQKYPNHKFLY